MFTYSANTQTSSTLDLKGASTAISHDDPLRNNIRVTTEETSLAVLYVLGTLLCLVIIWLLCVYLVAVVNTRGKRATKWARRLSGMRGVHGGAIGKRKGLMKRSLTFTSQTTIQDEDGHDGIPLTQPPPAQPTSVRIPVTRNTSTVTLHTRSTRSMPTPTSLIPSISLTPPRHYSMGLLVTLMYLMLTVLVMVNIEILNTVLSRLLDVFWLVPTYVTLVFLFMVARRLMDYPYRIQLIWCWFFFTGISIACKATSLVIALTASIQHQNELQNSSSESAETARMLLEDAEMGVFEAEQVPAEQSDLQVASFVTICFAYSTILGMLGSYIWCTRKQLNRGRRKKKGKQAGKHRKKEAKKNRRKRSNDSNTTEEGTENLSKTQEPTNPKKPRKLSPLLQKVDLPSQQGKHGTSDTDGDITLSASRNRSRSWMNSARVSDVDSNSDQVVSERDDVTLRPESGDQQLATTSQHDTRRPSPPSRHRRSPESAHALIHSNTAPNPPQQPPSQTIPHKVGRSHSAPGPDALYPDRPTGKDTNISTVASGTSAARALEGVARSLKIFTGGKKPPVTELTLHERKKSRAARAPIRGYQRRLLMARQQVAIRFLIVALTSALNLVIPLPLMEFLALPIHQSSSSLASLPNALAPPSTTGTKVNPPEDVEEVNGISAITHNPGLFFGYIAYFVGMTVFFAVLGTVETVNVQETKWGKNLSRQIRELPTLLEEILLDKLGDIRCKYTRWRRNRKRKKARQRLMREQRGRKKSAASWERDIENGKSWGERTMSSQDIGSVMGSSRRGSMRWPPLPPAVITTPVETQQVPVPERALRSPTA